MAQQEAKRLANIAMSNIREEDYIHRGFLKPIQIALKTYKTEMLEEDNDEKIKRRSLPAGLKIAVSTSVNGQGRKLKDIQPIQEYEDYQALKIGSKDNILTLMKKKRPSKRKHMSEGTQQELQEAKQNELEGIKVAICVCMYSETKTMLKKTLAGISENIANMVAYEGVDPDDIGVFVMMDGIQKVDESIIGYFEELQKSSNINLGDNIIPSLSMLELSQRASTMSIQQINNEQMKNVNNYLFDAVELQERNNLRFQSVRNLYFQKKQLLDDANKLKKGNKKLSYDDLNRPLQAFFLEEAKKMRKQDYNLTDEQVNQLKTEVIIDEYVSDIRRARPMIANALQRAVEHSKAYLRSKEDLAYLSCFRKKIKFKSQLLNDYYQEIDKTLHQTSGEGLAGSLHATRQSLEEEEENTAPSTIMNLFLCVKYKNAGKLSSHNWFFNGFCKELRPQFAILLDVGLQPEGTALLKMYKFMEQYPSVGGVCGYMSLKMEKLEREEQINDQEVDCLTNIASKFVDIQRTQQVEYHFAHLMDKPFEASFGFIHVLPGAFSAYNMEAILKYDQNEDDELLLNYFKSIDQKLATQKIMKNELGIANAFLRTALPDVLNRYCISIDPESDEAMLYNENVYLAEDRILCMGIHKKGFDMAFLPDAYAEVDPIKTVHGLLGQRKRWINGSYFAFQKVKKELSQMEQQQAISCGLNLQIFYLTFMNSMAYFSPSLFMFTVHIAIQAFRYDVLTRWLATTVSSSVLDYFVFTVDFIYVMMISGIIFYSLHFKNNFKEFKAKIYLVSTVFGIFMLVVMGILLVDIVKGLISNSTYLQNNIAPGQSFNTVPQSWINLLRYFLIASMLLYFVPLIVYWLLFWRIQPICQVLLGYLSFIFYSPTYLNILNIYSLCRIDDISWGTKGLDSAGSGKNADLKAGWKLIKFVHVFKYVFWNIVVAAVLLTLGQNYQTRFWVTFGMVCMIGGSVGLKVIVGIIYMIIYKFRSPKIGGQPNLSQRSRIADKMNKYKPAIRKQIESHLEQVKQQYETNDFLGSFIQAARTNKGIKNAFKKKSMEKQAIVSSILQMVSNKKRSKVMVPIREEDDEESPDSAPIKGKKKQGGGGFLELFAPGALAGSNTELNEPNQRDRVLLDPISIGSANKLMEEEDKFEVKKPTATKDQFRKGNK